MAILPVVLRPGLCITEFCSFCRRALSGKVQILRRQTDAFYALLPLVPPESQTALAREAFP